MAVAEHIARYGPPPELPALARSLAPDPAVLAAIDSASDAVADEAVRWMLLALWVVQRPGGAGLRDFEHTLVNAVSRAAIPPGNIGRVWTLFERQLGQVGTARLTPQAAVPGQAGGPCEDSSPAPQSRRQKRLHAALSGNAG